MTCRQHEEEKVHDVDKEDITQKGGGTMGIECQQSPGNKDVEECQSQISKAAGVQEDTNSECLLDLGIQRRLTVCNGLKKPKET